MARRISRLCSYCSAIDFSILFLPFSSEIENLWSGIEPTQSGFFQRDLGATDQPPPLLGTVRRILKNKGACELCRIFGDIIEKWAEMPGTLMNLVRPLENQDLLCWVSYHIHYGFGNFRRHQYSLDLRVGYDHRDASLASIQKFLGTSEVDSHATRRVTIEDGVRPSLFLSNRIRPFQLDPSLIRGWIDLCETQHQSTCYTRTVKHHPDVHLNIPSYSQSTASENYILRLVDVVERRIVLVSSKHELKYAALSYVWGSSKHPTSLRTDNLELLQKPQSLPDHSLSQTIRDFLSLVTSLQISYAWIDALCIVQDDEDDMAAQIAAMSSIFEGAFLTVINAGGDSIHAGLPGVRAGTRHKAQEEITVLLSPDSTMAGESEPETISLMTTLNPTDGSQSRIEASVWMSRAWTYQERMLSSRVLVFTPEQVLWTCPGARFSEEVFTECEQDFVRPVVLDSSIDYSLPSAHAGGGDIDMDDQATADKVWGDYALYVQAYSSRNLTYSGDVYNAFCGIEQNFSSRTGDRLVWGLPTSRFDLAIGWDNFDLIETAGIGRRTALSTLKVPPQMISIVFPSWSWMGWEGKIKMTVLNQREAGHEAAVRCHYHQTMPELSIVPACERQVHKHVIEKVDHIAIDEVSLDDVYKEYPRLTCEMLRNIPDRTLLFFWTQTSFFKIEYPSIITNIDRSFRRSKTRPAILDQEGNKVGECCSTAFDVPETVVHAELAIIGNHEDEHNEFYGSSAQVRVLQIQRNAHDIHPTGIKSLYERISIGRMTKSAWMGSQRQRKLIVLQ